MFKLRTLQSTKVLYCDLCLIPVFFIEKFSKNCIAYFDFITKQTYCANKYEQSPRFQSPETGKLRKHESSGP